MVQVIALIWVFYVVLLQYHAIQTYDFYGGGDLQWLWRGHALACRWHPCLFVSKETLILFSIKVSNVSQNRAEIFFLNSQKKKRDVDKIWWLRRQGRRLGTELSWVQSSAKTRKIENIFSVVFGWLLWSLWDLFQCLDVLIWIHLAINDQGCMVFIWTQSNSSWKNRKFKNLHNLNP